LYLVQFWLHELYGKKVHAELTIDFIFFSFHVRGDNELTKKCIGGTTKMLATIEENAFWEFACN